MEVRRKRRERFTIRGECPSIPKPFQIQRRLGGERVHAPFQRTKKLKGGEEKKKKVHDPFQRVKRLKGEFFWGQIDGKEEKVGKEISNSSPIPQEDVGKNASKTYKERMITL
jgi:hypothetical protein